MPGREAKTFLGKHPPFSLLDEPSLLRFVQALSLQVFPSGSHVLRQGEAAPRALYIVKEGTVRIYVRTPAGEEQVIDYRSAGDSFGFLSRGEDERLDASVQAVDDVVCYVADAAAVLRLAEEHPALQEYLLPGYFPARGPAGVAAPPALAPGLPHDGSVRALFTTPVDHLARRDVLTVGAATPVLEAARLMSDHRVGSLVVADDAGRPVGILTMTDLRDRVLVAGRDTAAPVAEIMSAPLVAAAGGELCFEALLTMMSRNVHHLPVLEGGRLVGILSNHDLMVLQGASPLLLAREIQGQSAVEGLAACARRVQGLVSLLLREGTGARSIMHVISAVNDLLERRILDLALATLGAPPLPLCWIVYGSAGRKEQTFKTDQDNAIVHGDARDETEAGAAREYFGRFAGYVVDAFQRCGFARCRGNYMASNPQWRQPLEAWKHAFTSWIYTPDDAAVHHACNLFDFRGLHGDARLAEELKGHLQRAIAGQTFFLKAIADVTVDYRPPLGVFGSLPLEKGGEHANQVDLKRYCLTPLVNVVRLFSFESGVPETPTLERLAVLKGAHPVARAVADDLAHAFDFLSLLRIRRQHELIVAGLEPDNFVDPQRLSSLELHNLKEICRLLSQVIDGIAKKYGGEARI